MPVLLFNLSKEAKSMKNIFITTILLFVLTFGCKSEEMELPQNNQTNNNFPAHSYLALGDSYTIGQGVAENQRYPVQLKDSLLRHGIDLNPVTIIARTGWTTDELSVAIDGATLNPPYDLVTLLIGVNNQYRGRTPENYRPEFVALLQQSIDFAGGNNERVIVLSIPDWGVTPFAHGRDREQIAREIDAFNAVNKEEAEKAGVAWIDVTAISREAATRPELLAPDNLHPSGLMYSYWVKDMLPIVLEILSE